MISIQNKIDCCGCNACGDVCHKNAITFKTDIEGFWYPEVDKDKCNNCGLCEKVCPIINVNELKKNDLQQSVCYAAIHKNLEVRFDSTSGGLFSALAEKTSKEGGFVGGAVYTEDYHAKQFISNDKNDLVALRSSKYLQSNAEDFFKSVKKLVVSGEKVLVCGTPCQMAALRAFLNYKNYDNLIIVDFVCRGVNSPKVFRKYLDYLEEKNGGKIVYVKSKVKDLGWRQLTTKVIFDNKKVAYETKDNSYFAAGYLQTGVFCRPSCYDCKFKQFPRIADITIADFWGAETTVSKDLDNDLGTSLVMINSSKGEKYFETIKQSIKYVSIPFDATIKGNPALVKPLNPPLVDRDRFYEDLDKGTFGEIVKKYIVRNIDRPLDLKHKLYNTAKFILNVFTASGLSLNTFWQNIKYNFFYRNIHTKIPAAHYLLFYKHCVVEISKTAHINLNGIFKLGVKRMKKSSIETRILIEDNAIVDIDRGVSLIMYGGDLEIFKGAKIYFGGDCGPNINSTIICADNIYIGRGVKMGRNVTIRDNNGGHYLSQKGYKTSIPIHIGQHSWLCEGCTILTGAKVGDGAIIGAYAVVSNRVPAFSLVAGNPAQIIEENIYWKY